MNDVKISLQRDGWTITHDPLSISTEDGTDVAIDLAAERLIAAEKSDEKQVHLIVFDPEERIVISWKK